jgi:hypothetical protein
MFLLVLSRFVNHSDHRVQLTNSGDPSQSDIHGLRQAQHAIESLGYIIDRWVLVRPAQYPLCVKFQVLRSEPLIYRFLRRSMQNL